MYNCWIYGITQHFLMLLSQTHNHDYINEIMQKCYIYYIEFLTQININDNHLNLTALDALMFMFKKSIFNESLINENKIMVLTSDEVHIIEKLTELHCHYFKYYTKDAQSIPISTFTKHVYMLTQSIICVKDENDIKNITEFILFNMTHNIGYEQCVPFLLLFIEKIKTVTFPNNRLYTLMNDIDYINIVKCGDDKKFNKILSTKITV